MKDTHDDTPSMALPHSIEAEQQILGALLTNNDLFDKVVGDLKSLHFFDPVHGLIYERITERINAGLLASPVTLAADMGAHPKLEPLGGASYLVKLAGSAMSSSAIKDYSVTILDLAAKRALMKHMDLAADRIASGGMSGTEIALKLETGCGQLISKTSTKPLIRSSMHAVTAALDYMNKAFRNDTPPGVTSGIRQLDDAIGSFRPSDFVLIAGRPAMGKAQPLSEPVLTPEGWRPIGELRIGDEVSSVDGKRSKVTGVFPQGKRPVYRVTFSDGRYARCNEEHLWAIESSRFKGQKVRTTGQILQILSVERYQGRIWVPTISGEVFKESVLPIDPWLLGFLLGDGCLQKDAVGFSTPDPDLVVKVKKVAGERHRVERQGEYGYRLCGVKHGQNETLSALRALGLDDKRSFEKTIPTAYLHGSRAQRAQLLMGLLDSDGWVEKFGAVRIGSTSRDMADQIVYLVRSLGGMAQVHERSPSFTYKGEKKAGRQFYTVNLQHEDIADFISLARKSDRCSRRHPPRLRIVSIERDGLEDQVCISVSHKTRLYITRDFVVTHNSSVALNLTAHAAERGIGVFHGSLEMPSEQLMMRLQARDLARRGIRIPYTDMMRGSLTDDQFRQVVESSRRMGELPIEFGERDVREIGMFRAAVRRAKQKFADETPLGLIVVDYVQQMQVEGVTRIFDRVSHVSDALKSLAMEFNIPVVGMAQLNRSVEMRDPPIPTLSDLRESGKLEEDTDMVMFCYRNSYYAQKKLEALDPDDMDKRADLEAIISRQKYDLDLIIDKNRNGPTRRVKAFMDMATCHLSGDARAFDPNPEMEL